MRDCGDSHLNRCNKELQINLIEDKLSMREMALKILKLHKLKIMSFSKKSFSLLYKIDFAVSRLFRKIPNAVGEIKRKGAIHKHK